MNIQASVNTNTNGSTSQMISRDKELDSLGESLGEFKVYDSQLPIAEITGTRIVKCLYQVAKATGKKVAENSYVRIPTKHLTEELIVSRVKELSPYVLAYLQELESLAIKAEHKKGSLRVYTDYLSMDKIIESLEQVTESARLTKDKISDWFTANLEESLMVLFADKMNLGSEITEAQELKLASILNAYKSKFVSLANPKAHIKEEDCASMINIIEKCEAEDSIIGSRFVTKLKAMSEKTEDLLEGL